MWEHMCLGCILGARDSKDKPKMHYFCTILYLIVVVPFTENYAAGIHKSDFSSFLFLTESLKSHLLFSSYSTFVNLNPYTFLIYFVIMPTRKEAP